ncbi:MULTISPECIES: D-alanyl-D-alanine carboxypeptidase [Streptomyces]|uniref:D-alanyl-D-alanine carboxypeptidase n=1 Tax=Streptomyces TaxID=1883 RepID=UPI001FFDD930|nr:MULTISPECIES: D-alanyl-D-alanine carboxypeptidase [Streptomyces]WTC49441.1 D-alanyl-D-alanine carboxypeptidase [Streptomyces anthocyanicus]
MEEASVAGESPDSSKQRESSEEPTSGSAGPVPEARTEASERRDPRLAVAREDAKRSAGSAGSGSGGIDTATRVLSVRETGPEAEASGEDDAAGADASSDAPVAPERSESPDGSEGGDATPTAGSDGRLRDAVAAWVATADERAAANARLGDAPDAEESSRNGDEDDETEAPEGAGDAPSREAAAPQDTERAEQADGDAADDAGPDAGSASDGAQGSTTAADPDTDAEAGAAPDSGSGTDAAPAPAPDTKPDQEPDADSEPAPDAQAASSRDGDADDDTGGAAPDSGSDADATPAPDAKPDQEPDADSEPAPDAQAASSRDGDADGDDGPPPVDQPTAVFKAPRPGRPAVDQPTTMLKLGDAASAAKKAGQKSGQKSDGPARSEGDAERTSKFVALRNPDDPANRRPPGTAQSAPAAEAPKAPATEPKGPQAPRTGVTAARSHVGPDRTTQQPLPPKPPLDLLAELTNTPPPPETPLRTTVRRVKIWTPLVILLVIVFGVVQSMRPLPAPTLDLTAQDSFSFDGGKPQIPWPESGQAALDVQGIGSFGSSGDQKPVPIASVAKVMTAYLVLRDHPLKSGAEGPKIKIDQAAEDQSQAGQESTVDVFAGDSISQREALQAILIASANNVARLLARWDAGSEKAFVEKMNGAAKDLGMTNTTYTDPSGLNNTTVSTAVDQVKLAKAAMKEPAFREVAAMMSYNDYKGENHGNWNQLVGHNGVVGIKTGTTTSALGNLVFAAKKEVGGETRTIVGAVVRQPDVGGGILDAALDASDELIRAAQDTLKSSTIIKKGSVVGYVDDGLGGRTPVVASQDVKAVGWGGLTVKLTFTADEVPHTAKAGTKVGTLTVGDGGTSGAVKVPVALGSDLVEPGFTDKLTRLG